MKLDFIKQIMSEFDQSNVTKMKVEIDDLKIELEKESEKVEYVKPLEKENKMVAEVNTKEPTGTPVKSPIVGVFYSASMKAQIEGLSFLWIKDLAQPDKWILPIAAAVATFISFSMSQSTMNTGGAAQQTAFMTKIMKYFFPIMILWMARSYPAGLAVYWFGSQVIQIFYNMRFNSWRKKQREEREAREAKNRKRRAKA